MRRKKCAVMEFTKSHRGRPNKDESGPPGEEFDECPADLDRASGCKQIRPTFGPMQQLTRNLPNRRSVILGSSVTIFLLLFIYTFPRVIIAWLGEGNPWTSYLYLYGFGGGFFLMGIFIILRTGACQLNRGYDRRWFWVLVGGFFFFALIHALWIVAALQIPYKGI